MPAAYLPFCCGKTIWLHFKTSYFGSNTAFVFHPWLSGVTFTLADMACWVQRNNARLRCLEKITRNFLRATHGILLSLINSHCRFPNHYHCNWSLAMEQDQGDAQGLWQAVLGDFVKQLKWALLNSLPTIWESHPTKPGTVDRHWSQGTPLSPCSMSCLQLPYSRPESPSFSQGPTPASAQPKSIEIFTCGRGETEPRATCRGPDLVDKLPSF